MPETGADFHPRATSTISSSKMSEHLDKVIPIEDRVISGLGLTWTGLTAHLAIGELEIAGRFIEFNQQVDEVLDANATNYIYVDSNANVGHQTNPSIPADALLIHVAVTNASTVTDHAEDYTTDTAIRLEEDLVAPRVESQGEVAGARGRLQGADPYLEFVDVGGSTYRIWARDGKLQVTNAAGTTVYTTDLANIAKPVDETSVEPTKDKTVSNLLAKGWQDTKTVVDAATPNATANAVAKRDASGRLKVVAGSASTDAANKSQVDAVANSLATHEAAADPHVAAGYIKADGSRAFTAAQSMGNQRLTNVGAPTGSADAARKQEVDTKVAKAGDTMTGNLDFGGTRKVTGLAAPTADNDATRRAYVDAADATASAAAAAAQADADAAQADINAHEALQTAGVHGSTVAATANKLVHRDAAGRAKFADPAADDDASTKGYVDTSIENASSISDLFLLMGA